MNYDDMKSKNGLKDIALGELNATDCIEFRVQFENILKHQEARDLRGIVYFFVTTKPVSRLSGESDIIYIGKTDNTLLARYRRKNIDDECDDYHWKRYNYLLKECRNSIKVFVAKSDDPKKMEEKLINEYYNDHLDIPPLNRQG